MKNIKYFIIALFTLVASTSCNKFLDVNPDGEKLETDIFSTASGFEDAIFGAYSSLTVNNLYGKYLSFYFPDLLADYFYSDVSTAYYLCDGDLSTPSTAIDNIWSTMYESIGYVNNILDNLDESEDAKDYVLYDIYRAECLALRAFCHFELTRYFCQNILNNPNAQGIPYREHYDFTVTAFDDLSVTYEKIIADLLEAEEIQGDSNYFGTDADVNTFLADQNMHFNIHAIRGILARIYWTMGDLENAAIYAKKVIESEQFSLISTYGELQTFVGAILSEKETVLGFYGDDFWYETWQHFYYANSTNYLSPFFELDEDQIKELYMLDKDDSMVEYRYENWFYEVSNGTDKQGFRCMKIVDTYHLDGESLTSTRSDYAIEGPNILKLPELHYIMAEYYLSIGDQANAKLYFDPVIESRGLTGYATRGTDITLDIINNERKKEYFCEGQYFHVMKKYNMSYNKNSTGETFEASDDFYVFGIPDSETSYRDDI